jgi:hypothetical protein
MIDVDTSVYCNYDYINNYHNIRITEIKNDILIYNSTITNIIKNIKNIIKHKKALQYNYTNI